MGKELDNLKWQLSVFKAWHLGTDIVLFSSIDVTAFNAIESTNEVYMEKVN